MILGPSWSASEVAALNRAVASGLDWDAVARVVPGRTIGACQARLKRQENLKLRAERKAHVRKSGTNNKKAASSGIGRGGNRPWTAAEDEMLMELLTDGKSGPLEVREAFPDRSEMAVAYRVGIIWSRQGRGVGTEGEGAEIGQIEWDADAEESSYSDLSYTSSPPARSTATPREFQRGPYASTANDSGWSGPTINTPVRPVDEKMSGSTSEKVNELAGKATEQLDEELALVQAQVSIENVKQLMARLEKLEKSNVELWGKVVSWDE